MLLRTATPHLGAPPLGSRTLDVPPPVSRRINALVVAMSLDTKLGGHVGLTAIEVPGRCCASWMAVASRVTPSAMAVSLRMA